MDDVEQLFSGDIVKHVGEINKDRCSGWCRLLLLWFDDVFFDG